MSWFPPKINDWDHNYYDLTDKLATFFDINIDAFELKDNEQCIVNDGDDLYAIYNLYISTISISNQLSTTGGLTPTATPGHMTQDSVAVPDDLLELTANMDLPDTNGPRMTHSSSKIQRILSSNNIIDDSINIVTIDLQLITIQITRTDSYDMDWEEVTDKLLSDMDVEEVSHLRDELSKDDHKFNKSRLSIKKINFRMDWQKACNAIKHEMWSKLASSVRAIVNDKNRNIDQYDLSVECINKVINILKEERHLAVEEREYLRKLLKRCAKFRPAFLKMSVKDKQQSYTVVSDDIENDIYTDFDIDESEKGLNMSLLIDIFNVHRVFRFSNFHFKEYSVSEYRNQIEKRCKQIFGDELVEKCKNDITFSERFNLYPGYVIDDNMFRIFEYHFGVSLFVNRLINN
eukprot:227401_1